MSIDLTGSCDCGRVKLEVDAERANIVNCHCGRCRKLSGSAFSTYLVVAEKNFRISAGKDFLSSYNPSEKGVRSFCSNCGSPVLVQNLRYPKLRMVPIGALPPIGEIIPKVNIFCESKLPWVAFNCETADFTREIER